MSIDKSKHLYNVENEELRDRIEELFGFLDSAEGIINRLITDPGDEDYDQIGEWIDKYNIYTEEEGKRLGN